MKKMFNVLSLLLVFYSFGCTRTKSDDKVEAIQEEKFYAVKEDIELLISPSPSSKKLINEKASSITKDTEYCKLDKTCKLIIMSTSSGYSKVKVIEPEWLSGTYIGWVPTTSLMEFGALTSTKLASPSMVAAFNNVNALISELSKNGIGEMRSWRSDGAEGFMSITDYYRFGTASSASGLNNNIAYYLESDNENYAKKLSIVLNIFNSSERLGALAKFETLIKKTFSSLKLKTPSGLNSAIKVPKAYSYESKFYAVSVEREKNNIESWKLTIESN